MRLETFISLICDQCDEDSEMILRVEGYDYIIEDVEVGLTKYEDITGHNHESSFIRINGCSR